MMETDLHGKRIMYILVYIFFCLSNKSLKYPFMSETLQ